jgi:L-malate glycosyltransferase
VLAAALARQMQDRYNFVFICIDRIGPLGEQLAKEGFVVKGLDRKPGIDLNVAKGIRQCVNEHNVQLIHAHQYTPFFYSAVSRSGLGLVGSKPPVLFTEHGRHYPDVRKTKRVIFNKLLLHRKDRVTAVGEFVKQALINNEGINGKRIDVIYNGIDVERFNVGSDAAMRELMRTELGLAPGQVALLQVARFHSVKDHATAIRGFAHAVDQGKDSLDQPPVFLLVGDGDHKDKMEALGQELGITQHLRFLGVRKDIPQLMAAADVFTLSSLSEGISVTLLEAEGASLPVAATNVGGNGEVVVDRETGLLSPRGDAKGLGENLATLFLDEDMRHRMGRAGRAHLLAQFTEGQMHEKFASVYDDMAG